MTRERMCGKKREDRDNYDNIDTSIKRNLDARASFKGGTPFIHKAAGFASDNPLVAEAIFALLITCGLRPASIMATASNKEDKDKCAYQAAKSISSGLIGLATTFIVATPIAMATKYGKAQKMFKMPPSMQNMAKKVVKLGYDELKSIQENVKTSNPKLSQQISDVIDHRIIENKKVVNGKIEVEKKEIFAINLDKMEKIENGGKKAFREAIKKESPNSVSIIEEAIEKQRMLNNFENTAKNVADKFFQPIFMPIRASITIAAIPPLLNCLGLKKKSDNQTNVYNNLDKNAQKVTYKIQDNSKQKVFQPFLGANNHANKCNK